MLYKEFFSILILVFIGWVAFAGSNSGRIERGCRPVGWTGSVVTSLASLGAPAYAKNTQAAFDKVEYGCRYVVWRVFFGSEWEAWKAQQAAAQQPNQTGSAQPAQAAPAAIPSSAPGSAP